MSAALLGDILTHSYLPKSFASARKVLKDRSPLPLFEGRSCHPPLKRLLTMADVWRIFPLLSSGFAGFACGPSLRPPGR